MRLDHPNGKSQPSRGINAAMLVFPSLPADGQGYFLQLESSLPQSTHVYSTHAVHFKANTSFKLVKLVFKPEPKVLEHELGHGSYLALPLMVTVLVIYFSRLKVLPFFNRVVQFINSLLTRGVSSRVINTAPPDHGAADAVVVEPVISVSKRKVKPRKT
jgi:hypothetical protein